MCSVFVFDLILVCYWCALLVSYAFFLFICFVCSSAVEAAKKAAQAAAATLAGFKAHQTAAAITGEGPAVPDTVVAEQKAMEAAKQVIIWRVVCFYCCVSSPFSPVFFLMCA